MMRDCDALVSRRTEPVRYDGPETLDGHTLGLLRGHRSPRIDDYIAAGGDVRRAEGTTYRETFAKLQAGWIDAVLAPAYALPHLLRANARRAKVRVDLTEQSYSRRVLVLDGHAGLRDFIDRTLNNGPWRRKLRALIARYAGQP